MKLRTCTCARRVYCVQSVVSEVTGRPADWNHVTAA